MLGVVPVVPVVAVVSAVAVVAALSSSPLERNRLAAMSAATTTAATARAMTRVRFLPLFAVGGSGTGGIAVKSAYSRGYRCAS